LNVVKYLERMNQITAEGMDSLLVPNSTQNIEATFARLALRIFMNFCCGTDFSKDLTEEGKVCKSVSTASNNMGTTIVFNISPSLPFNPLATQLKEFVRYMWSALKPICDDRRKQMEAGLTFDDPLDAMLKENLSEDDMREHMITMIAAGHDTTAFFASYCVYALGEHPTCQDLLRTEIQTVLGNRQQVTQEDLNELKYLHKVMQEVLRLYAVIPIVTRVASEEVFVKEANVTIPKGANVMIPMFIMNRDPEIWERHNEFLPERFDAKGDFTSAKNGYFPFGYGTRTCIGNTLAQIEVAVFLCHLLRKYTIEPAPNYKLRIAAGISLTTSNGVKVMLKQIEK